MMGGAWALETPLLSDLEAKGVTWYALSQWTHTGCFTCLCGHSGSTEKRSACGTGVQLALPESFFSDKIIDGEKNEMPATATATPRVPSGPPPTHTAQHSLFADGGV